MLVVNDIVDLALEISIARCRMDHELIEFLCRFLDDGGGASSADTTEGLAIDGDVVLVHDDSWAAHLD